MKLADMALVSLKKYPPTLLEIKAHTDSRGSREYNRLLSQRRANAVKQYIIRKGISASRIKTYGLGETHLLNKCADRVKCSESQHAINRRVDMKVK
jgi:outer membrane protein OmpA-like peptidoglycan-associated protein